ncbi:hypothetical protein [Butyricimonas faecihominis]
MTILEEIKNDREKKAVTEILKEVDDFFSNGVSLPVRIINDCMVDFVTPEKIPLKEYQEDYINTRTMVLCGVVAFLVSIYEQYKIVGSDILIPRSRESA